MINTYKYLDVQLQDKLDKTVTDALCKKRQFESSAGGQPQEKGKQLTWTN